MRLGAIYKNGEIVFDKPVRFARDSFSVVVEIPEKEVCLEEALAPEGRSGRKYSLSPEMEARSKILFESLECIRNSLPKERDLPPLTEKQSERVEAFSMREES